MSGFPDLLESLRKLTETLKEVSKGDLARRTMQLMLEEQGVEAVNAETVLHRYPATIAGAWPLKPYAIANSRFQEVIFLDADTVPLSDPARCGSARKTGTLKAPAVARRRPLRTPTGP